MAKEQQFWYPPVEGMICAPGVDELRVTFTAGEKATRTFTPKITAAEA